MIETKEQWEKWAIKLQALAQAGLFYTKNEFERERYQEIRDIACEILATHSTENIDRITDLFCCERGYTTPKLDSRAVCFKDDKILMAQEKNGSWSVPGGWNDIDQTLTKNVVKEAKEEAGAVVHPKFVICLHDWKTHFKSDIPFNILKVFIYCELKEQHFVPNSETLQAEFFSIDNLPKMALQKNNYEQVELCFKAHEAYKNNQTWFTQFD